MSVARTAPRADTGAKPLVASVVISFDGSPVLAELLSQLSAASIPTVLVENGTASGIDASEVSRSSALLEGHGNVGYGCGANLGSREAIARWNPDWILVLNSDVVASTALFSRIPSVLHRQPKKVGCVVFPTVDRVTGDVRHDSTPRPGAFSDLRRSRFAPVREVVPRGAALAIRCRDLKLVRGFNPLFFLYFEETDLLDRLRDAGIAWRWAPDASAVAHLGAATTGRYARSTAFELGRSATLYGQRLPAIRRVTWLASRLLLLCTRAAQALLLRQRSEARHSYWQIRGILYGLSHSGEANWVLRELRAVPHAERVDLRIDLPGGGRG